MDIYISQVFSKKGAYRSVSVITSSGGFPSIKTSVTSAYFRLSGNCPFLEQKSACLLLFDLVYSKSVDLFPVTKLVFAKLSC